MIRWLLENLGLMLLALVMSVVVWVAAQWESNPILEQEFEQPIPVEVRNLSSGTYLRDGWQQEVEVRLRAPESVWDRLSIADVSAVLNLSPNLTPLEPGEYDVEVQVSVDAEPALLLEIEPRFLRVELEAIRERTVPVTVEIRGEPELGYEARDAVYTDTVKVRGPASQVDQVTQAVTSVSIRGLRETWDGLAPSLNPVDAEGNRVNGVTLDPEQIQVSVPIRPLPNVKEMSVTWTQVGQPAEGYHVTNIGIDPPVVRVRGPVFILDDLTGFLTTVPISVEGRTDDVIERVPLELPPGIAMFDPKEPAVQVTIEIEPYIDSVAVTSTVAFQGLRPGLVARASPEVVEVILSGPRPRLSTLLPEDVRVIVDLSDLRLGDEGQLEPIVVPPEGITVGTIIPSVIQVQIEREPPPTLTPTPQE
jgi:YbbR domain-containing protein